MGRFIEGGHISVWVAEMVEFAEIKLGMVFVFNVVILPIAHSVANLSILLRCRKIECWILVRLTRQVHLPIEC